MIGRNDFFHVWETRFASLIGRSKIRNAFSHSKIWCENLSIYKIKNYSVCGLVVSNVFSCLETWWNTRTRFWNSTYAPFRPVLILKNYHTLVILKRLKLSRNDNNDGNLHFEMTFSLLSPLSLLKFSFKIYDGDVDENVTSKYSFALL